MAAKNDGGSEVGQEMPAAPLPVQPGTISPEEVWVLYQASEIKNRALNEQIADRDQRIAQWAGVGVQLMQLLGVDHIEAVLPAVDELLKNREQRRAKTKPKTKPKAKGGRKR